MPQQPRSLGRVLIACLKLPFQILRTFVFVFMMALARALGGKPRIPNPEPQNIPSEVEKKR